MSNGSIEKPLIVKIEVKTAGVWRVEQAANTLLAIDRIAARVGIASHISETCEAYDYVIRHMGTFGLLGKMPESWEKPKSPTDLELRSDLAAFMSILRNAGVDTKITHLGVEFGFLVDDLSDIMPTSSRAEIESITMSSPGTWLLSLSGAIKSEGAFKLLEKIFDSIFFRDSTRRKKAAEARDTEAGADIKKAQARRLRAKARGEELTVRRQEAELLLDYAVAVDSLILALRNAGFDDRQTRRVLRDRLMTDVDLLARHKSMGLIVDLTASKEESDKDAGI